MCGAGLRHTLVDLGLSPLANSYVRAERAEIADKFYPLHARVCEECLLVQVDDVVPASEIFTGDYAYFSSFSESWLDHCRRYAGMARERFKLGSRSLVVEIASNDGYLLQFFASAGVPVLGVEPAANVAAAAEARGVPTRVAFFSEALAKTLRDEGRRPDLICSANVLAHVPDIVDFARGVATLLAGEAVYTVEFPHVLNMIEQTQFDTIYHEHYSYLSLIAIENLFARAGLRVFDVEELPTHGGSLRVYGCLEGASRSEEPGVRRVRDNERAAKLHTLDGYRGYDARVRAVRDGVRSYLADARNSGRKIAAYGAAAKGNTLLNYCGVTAQDIAYVVDRNPAKQGTLLPGSRIPVRPVETLDTERPDDLFILPWNLRAEIEAQLAHLKKAGVRFVAAIPQLTIDG
jgi:hypothetical protein